jgi:hypothetical protein
MYGWLVHPMICRGVRRLNWGDVGPPLAGWSKKSVLVFSGDHSWAGEYRERDNIEGFLRQFVRAGLSIVEACVRRYIDAGKGPATGAAHGGSDDHRSSDQDAYPDDRSDTLDRGVRRETPRRHDREGPLPRPRRHDSHRRGATGELSRPG